MRARAPTCAAIPASRCTAPSVDPPEGSGAGWAGDAKVAGRAVPAGDLDGPVSGELFRADIEEVVVTGLNEAATALVIESWPPARGLRRVERA